MLQMKAGKGILVQEFSILVILCTEMVLSNKISLELEQSFIFMEAL